MRVLITVLIVRESRHFSPWCLKSHLFWYLIAGMVLSTGGPARLVVTNGGVFIQRNTAKAVPFPLFVLGGWWRHWAKWRAVKVCVSPGCVCSTHAWGREFWGLRGAGMQITPYNAESKNSVHLPFTGNIWFSPQQTHLSNFILHRLLLKWVCVLREASDGRKDRVGLGSRDVQPGSLHRP
jgi:hypothetical protein